ncbi:zinc finger SWIM domain-containing protein 3-like [Panulirus ornatus]|uniref:zinc finger SWIM domain-containing protein 3-like n=1 Tax=Panulirus ornatus TaxID=150431 RepID=UPI003A87B422
MASEEHLIRVGDEFSSFEELVEAISRLEKVQNITYWRRHTRTIKAGAKIVKTTFNPALKYYQVHWACVKGGRPYQSKSTGQRPNQRTFKEDCGACVKVCASKDGQKLIVKQSNLMHSHPTSKDSYQFPTKQRRLNENYQEEVSTALQTKPDKKVLQDHIRKTTGKTVTLRDLTNHSFKINAKGSNLEEMLEEFINDPESIVDVLVDEENVLKGIYYQDETMKRNFERYPELLLIDATYKLNDVRMPVYLQLAVDGNGESEIVCVFVVVTEDTETMSALVDMFKSHNHNWEKIKTILTDKDFMEKAVYSHHFPDATFISVALSSARHPRNQENKVHF